MAESRLPIRIKKAGRINARPQGLFLFIFVYVKARPASSKKNTDADCPASVFG